MQPDSKQSSLFQRLLDKLAKTLIPGSHKTSNLNQKIEDLKEENRLLLERYEILTENLAAAVIIRNPDGSIAYCSPYTEVLTGYALAEIYDQESDFFLDIVHEEDREKFERALKVTAMGEAFQFRYRLYHKTGIEIWAETRTVPILDEDSELVSSLSITLDITGAARYQKQVEEQNRDLQDFTYMVTHDLKAPVYTIKGMLNLVAEDFGDSLNPDLKEPLDHIDNATKRLESLIASVLEYSKLTSLENIAEAVDLNSVTKDLESDYAQQLAEHKATMTIDANLPVVSGERLRIYQVFSNLVGNAIKYRHEERPLEIKISIQPALNSRYSIICIKDNGQGIPKDQQEAIFRPFQRAHGNNIEGSGIGLACVKKIVEKFGGSVRVESEEGVGSSFFLMLKNYQEG